MKFTTVTVCLLSATALTSAAPVAHLQVENGVQGLSHAVPRGVSDPTFSNGGNGAPGEFANPDVKWLNKFLNGMNGFFDGMSRWFSGQ
ncbi:hypothetical protein TWF281_011082 [Arthrobotrys megalospora]